MAQLVKCLYCKQERPEFDPQIHIKKKLCVSVCMEVRGRDKPISGAHWTAKLTYLAGPMGESIPIKQ